jgi:hypothetical protein
MLPRGGFNQKARGEESRKSSRGLNRAQLAFRVRESHGDGCAAAGYRPALRTEHAAPSMERGSVSRSRTLMQLEVQKTNQALIDTSRQAGMAEVATRGPNGRVAKGVARTILLTTPTPNRCFGVQIGA